MAKLCKNIKYNITVQLILFLVFYSRRFETANGIHVQETGYIKNKGDKKHETLVQKGEITYYDEHGKPITLTYVADENGFQPQGAHLPTPPPHSNGISGEESGENHAEEYVEHEVLNAEQYPHLLYQLVH